MNDSPSFVPPRLLVDGIAQFNRGEYFEQHETLETLWRAEPGPVRRLYQGILQIGVAFHHARRGNHHGVTVMLERGLRNVRPYAPACQGVDVARLIAETERAQEALAALGPDGLAAFDWRLAPRVHWTGGKV
jgi:predicted metal-dependent hydrolase